MCFDTVKTFSDVLATPDLQKHFSSDKQCVLMEHVLYTVSSKFLQSVLILRFLLTEDYSD